jgi:hypothetical protein
VISPPPLKLARQRWRSAKLTERQVDDDVRRSKMAVDVALGIREVRCRRTPRVRINRSRAAQHVRWDVGGIARPEPDLDEFRGALHRIPAKRVYHIPLILWRGQERGKFSSRTIHRRCY